MASAIKSADSYFKCHIGCLTIDALSDDDLLYMFVLYRRASVYDFDQCLWKPLLPWPWHTLAHVCQRWRRIIFAWPNQLGVQVECKSGTGIAKVLDVWPTFPISIWSKFDDKIPDGGDIIAGLKHRDRLAGVKLWGLTRSQLERCATLMQGSFPILQALVLYCRSGIPPVITDGFLGGSVPRLRELKLFHVPFPTLPNLLLTASDLVELELDDIPITGYISSDMMATCISMLPKLQLLSVGFYSQKSFPDLTNRRPPPPASAVLPALTRFVFKGVSEYSEDLMARIDAPLLNHLSLVFFYQPVFHIPQVPQFINRTKQLERPEYAQVSFERDTFNVHLRPWGMANQVSALEFSITGLDNQLSLLKQICIQCSPILSHVDALDLVHYSVSSQPSQHDLAPALLLEVLRLFNTVERLWIDGVELLMVVADALGSVTAEVLPVLDTIWVREKRPRPEFIDEMDTFLNARLEMGRPVEVEWVNW